MTALSTLIESLKRELAVPGTFDDAFPDSSAADLLGVLADGFAEAQLFGFFPTMSLTASTELGQPEWTTSEDLSLPGGMLVSLFAAARVLRAQIRTVLTLERYKAGPVEVEFGRPALVLKDELDYITDRIKKVIEDAKKANRLSATVHDNYLARGGGITSGGNFYPYEYKG